MSLYVEISRRRAGQEAWEALGNAEVCKDGKTLTNLSIAEEGLVPGALERIAGAIARDQKPHPEEELADQVGTVKVGEVEFHYKTVFANPQVPGG
jgi:hypothetical protein